MIYGFAHRKGVDADELYDVLAIGLCKAALTFDESKGYKFSTLAYRCMEHEYLSHLRDEFSSRRVPQYCMVPLSEAEEYIGVDDGSMLDLSKPRVHAFVSSLTDRQKSVLRLLMAGYNDADAASRLMCSRQSIYNTRKAITVKWLKQTEVEPS